jgi:hypothetical protein
MKQNGAKNGAERSNVGMELDKTRQQDGAVERAYIELPFQFNLI